MYRTVFNSSRFTLVLLVLLSACILAPAADAATVSWAVDADGNWNVGTNWSGGSVPTAADDVVIDRPAGLYTITVPTGTHAALSIVSNENLVLDAGTLSVSGTVQVNADFRLEGTILVGATVQPGSGGEGVEAVSGTLDGVVMNADMNISGTSSRTITLKNGLTLNGTALMGDVGTAFGRFLINGSQTLDGTGEIVLGGASGNNGITPTTGGDLVVESGITIHGARGVVGGTSRRLVLKGPVIAEAAGQQILVQGDSLFVQNKISAINGGNLRFNNTWVNQDTIEVGTGSTLDLDGTWENQGTILLTGASATLGGTFTAAAVGDFVRSGGTVVVDGTLDNTGNALVLDADTGTWELVSGGVILNGSVEPGLAGSELTYAAGTLDGVTMNADMDLSETSSISVTLKNGLTLNGTVLMGDEGSAFGRFLINGSQTLDGTGEIVLGGASTANGINFATNSDLVVESGLTIHGGKGTLGSGSRGLVLKAPVTAEISGQEILVQGDSLYVQAPVTGINGGHIQLNGVVLVQETVSLTGGGTLHMTGTWTNADTLVTGAGCTMNFDGTWDNQGAIRPTDTAVTLGGTFTYAAVGDFVRSGGTVVVDGTLDNTGNALVLDADTGTWELVSGGVILNGSVEPGLAGSELTYASGTLDGVTMNADMDMSEPSSISVTLKNGLTLNGTVLMGDEGSAFGRFLINGSQTLDGTGEIVLGSASTANGINFATNSDLVVESGLTIHGGKGTLGSGSRGLVLKAPVTAEISGQEILVQGDSLYVQAPVTGINGGNVRLNGVVLVQETVSLTGGGTLHMTGTWTNADTLVTGAGCTMNFDGTWDNQGAIRPTDTAVSLGGTFTYAAVGDFVRSGGTVVVDGTLDNTGNALVLDADTGTWELVSGGVILNGSVEPGVSGSELTYASGTLDGVTMNADMDMSEPSSISVTLKNGLTLNGTVLMGDEGSAFGRFLINGSQTLDGTGEIVLGSASTANGINFATNSDLVVESGLTIHGGKGTLGSGSRGLVLKAPVTAEISGQEILVQGDSLYVQAPVTGINGGHIQLNGVVLVQETVSLTGGGTLHMTGTWTNADTLVTGAGCTMNFDGTWDNQGAIRPTDTAVKLGGTFTYAAVGDFVRSGGTVVVDGTLDNTGNALVLDANTGTWELVSGGVILNGSVEPGLAGSDLTYAGGTLDGVTMNADMDLSETSSISVTLKNGLTLNGTVLMGDEGTAYGRFLISGTQTIDGTGEMVLGSASTTNGINFATNSDLVVESGLTIHGSRGTLGSTSRGFTNRGTISADSAGVAIRLRGSPWLNEGTVAAAGGIIDNGATFTTSDSVRVDSLSTFSGTGTFTQTTGSTRIAATGTLDQTTVDIQNGTFTCGGTVDGELSMSNGTIAPGASPGLLNGTGGYTQTGGNVAVELAGTDPADYDRMAFVGTAALAGTLDVSLLNGFQPALADTFTVLAYAAKTDSFDVVNLPTIDPGLCWLVETDTNALRLIAEVNPPPVALCSDTTLIADLNCEGTVTAAALDAGTFDPKGEGFSLALDPPGPYPIGVNLVNFIATDTRGAADTCLTTITVTNAPPVAASSDTTMIAVTGTCDANVTAAALDAGTADPEGHSFTLALEPAGPYAIGVHLVNFIATDQCGAADTTQSTITVVNNAPVAVCKDVLVPVDTGECTATVAAAAADDGTSDPDGHGVTLALDPAGPYAIGANVVNFIATDECGLADTCVTTITVINTAPVAACKDTTVIGEGVPCVASLVGADLDDGSSDADTNPLTLTLEPAGPYGIGTHVVDFIATDACGAADTCQATITVTSNPPTATCQDITVPVDTGTCEATVAASAVDNGTADPDGDPFSLALDPAGPYAIGDNLVNFIATDSCGFADTCLATITVINTAPVAACKDTTVIGDGADCIVALTPADLDIGTTEPDGQTFTLALVPPGPYGVGVHVVDFIATDVCGAADTCQTTITVTSNPPVALCQDITVPVDTGACVATVAASAVDNGTTDPDGDPFSLLLDPAGPYAIGDNLVNFIATDTCGFADTCLATITVINTAPIAACLDTTVLADTSSCEVELAAAALDNGSVEPDGQGLTFTLDPEGPYGIGTHAVDFIATDDCGLSDTCQVTITVINTRPTAVALDEVVVQSDSTSCLASPAASIFDNGSNDPEVSNLIFTTDPPAPYPLGVTLLKLIVSDGCESDTADTRIVVECSQVGLPDTIVPTAFRVASASPNPFRGATRIQLDLPEARYVRAQVFDVTGRTVAVLANETMSAGTWQLAWNGRRDDGRDVGTGIYLLRVQAGKDVVVQKALLTR